MADSGDTTLEGDEAEGVGFLQSEKKPAKGTDGKLCPIAQCHDSGDMGH